MRRRAAANSRKIYAAACGQPRRPAKALAACADAGRAAATRPVCIHSSVDMHSFFCETPLAAGIYLRRESAAVVSFVVGFGAWSKMKRRAVRALYELLRLVDGGEDPVRTEGIVWRQQFAPSSPKNPLLP